MYKVKKSFYQFCMENEDKKHLLDEWDYEKNNELNLDVKNIGFSVNVQAWWKCKHGHSWKSNINNRVHQKGNCPYCINKKIVTGFNDLSTTHPELIKEWHPTKNGTFSPTQVSAGSAKKVWWICERGHEWEATIVDRVAQKRGCPYCAGQKVWAGFNDLATTHPELAKEWNYKKNTLKPTEISAGSHKKVWWTCEKGHEYESIPNARTSMGSGCPYCSGHKVLKGFNDLATTHPELAAEWHPTKNGDTKATDVTAGINRNFWWKCDKGHEWKITISNRTRGETCPICSNHKILKGFNDLATTHPEVVKQWHPTKNGDLQPTEVGAGTSKKAWWICEKGHEWETEIRYKAKLNTGCPCCLKESRKKSF